MTPAQAIFRLLQSLGVNLPGTADDWTVVRTNVHPDVIRDGGWSWKYRQKGSETSEVSYVDADGVTMVDIGSHVAAKALLKTQNRKRVVLTQAGGDLKKRITLALPESMGADALSKGPVVDEDAPPSPVVDDHQPGDGWSVGWGDRPGHIKRTMGG